MPNLCFMKSCADFLNVFLLPLISEVASLLSSVPAQSEACCCQNPVHLVLAHSVVSYQAENHVAKDVYTTSPRLSGKNHLGLETWTKSN